MMCIFLMFLFLIFSVFNRRKNIQKSLKAEFLLNPYTSNFNLQLSKGV